MHSFNQEDLVLYMYAEASHEKTAAIKAALETDWKLREQYEVLVAAQKSLEPVDLSPRKQTLDFIMNYAAAKQAKELTAQEG